MEKIEDSVVETNCAGSKHIKIFSAWAVCSWQWALKLKREVKRYPKRLGLYSVPQLQTRVGCKVCICICSRKLDMHAENSYPTDKDKEASQMLRNAFMSIFSDLAFSPQEKVPAIMPSKEWVTHLANLIITVLQLGSFCKGCAGPDGNASFNPWKSSFWHLDCFPGPIAGWIWKSGTTVVEILLIFVIKWYGQDWVQSPTLPLSDWANYVVFLSPYL